MQKLKAAIFLITWTSILCICSVTNAESNCTLSARGKLLSLASLNGTWPLFDHDDDNISQYEISFCGPVNTKGNNDNCSHSSICWTDAKGQRTSLTNFTDSVYEAKLLSGFSWLILNEGDKCLGDPERKYQVIMHFKCGSTIGSPELYLRSTCTLYFSWTTSAVCDIQPSRKEVPCYIYDKDTGIKHDLQTLIKSKGGYAVAGTGPDSLVINVCSDIAPDSLIAECPTGAAACLKREGKYYSAGHLKNALLYTRFNKLMQITYEDEGKEYPPGCDRAPKTVITFICPQQENTVHGPQLIASSNCQFEIIWEMLYACPAEAFSGNLQTCKFTNIYHGLEFDLSPLQIPSGKAPYHTTGIINNSRVDFFLNVCGGLGGDFPCNEKSVGTGWKSTSVCVKDHENKARTDASRVIGTLKNARFHYTDGNISLVYTGSHGCNNSNAYWGTVINFICDTSAREGAPHFVGLEECLYIFDWKTEYACPKHYSNHTCSLAINDDVKIDLEALHKKTGIAGWRVIDGTSTNGIRRQIFLNVCGDLERSEATSKCPSGSSICLTDNQGSGTALGRYSSLEYDAKNSVIILDYIYGDSCGTENIKSKLKLFCKTGDTSSNPILVKESRCYYEFEWHTGAACPKMEHIGRDCKIDDVASGLQFDLSPLTSEKAYSAESDDQKFSINVCAPVKGTECSHIKGATNIGACATNSKKSEENFSLGEANSDLVYKNGFLFLTYHGENISEGSTQTTRNVSIIFVCDTAAGIGKPLFVARMGEWYLFYWHTSHACLRRNFVDCTAVDSRTGVQYDLSSLTKIGKNTSWSAVERTGKRKFYLNICQPLLLESSLCSGGAAVCAVNTENGTEEKEIGNLGQALGSPIVQSDGHLVLTYTYGDECTSYGKKMNYSTTIHFICRKSDEDQGIRFLGAFDTCNYSFLWGTEAACSLESEETQNACDVTDSISGQMYNMMPLKLVDNFYNVTSESRKFRLNICGSVGNNGCSSDNKSIVSACEITSNGEIQTILGLGENYSLQVSPDMPVRLTYSNSTTMAGRANASSVEIRFKCAEKVSDIRFVQQQGKSYYFEMSSPLACKQPPVFCSINGPRGEHYDLTQLSHSPFKIASDTRPLMESIHYQLSFCSPLEYSSASPCHGAGACQMNLANQSEISLGYQQKPLLLLNDGSIIVRYTNGSKCQSRTNVKNSAEVKLHCSYKEHPVVFLGVESCNYKFFLETPAACFVQTYVGSKCAVTDLLSNQVFDLTPLKKENSNYNVTHEGYIYLLNVCDELAFPPRGCEGVGVCQTKEQDNFAVNAGMANQTLVYKDGLIQLTYNSGKSNCHKKYTRKTVITFVCDYTTDGIEEGPYFITEEGDCTYAFLWRTSYACRPYKTVDCTAQDDNGRVYELGTLAQSTDNYYVKDPLNSNRTFAINVCRTLVSQTNFRCLSSSAACLLDKSISKPKSHYPAASLGTKMESPKFVNGRLMLNYSLGESCSLTSGTEETHSEALIEFKCNIKEKFTTPEFIKQVGCRFFFLWETSAACPVSNVSNASNNCSVTDPRTGQVFNLTSLMSGKPTKVKIGSTQQFFLSVCAHINRTDCGPSSGACQYEKGKTVKAGIANSLLHYQDDELYLNYTGGDKCNGGASDRNTVIQFVCSHQVDGARFISRLNDCTYTFVWYTQLSCHKELPCVLEKDGITIDLSVLANNVDSTTIVHSAESRNSYFVNVCQPLMPKFCPPSAAICKVPFGTSLTLSLGRLWRSPYLDEEQKVTLEYKDGSKCPTDETKLISSRIIFLCDYAAGKGEPDVINSSEDQCEYLFEWRTSIVCTGEMLPKLSSSSHCTFEDKKKGFVIDLSKLWRNDKPFEVTSGKGKNMYLVNVCGGTRTEGDCQKASVCAVEGNKYGAYGFFEDSSLTMKGSRLILTSEGSAFCYHENTSERKKTEIIFTCDPSAGIGSPSLYREFPCSAVFLWTTSVTCPLSVPKCTLLSGSNFYDLRMFSSISHSWSAIDAEGNTYWLNVCNEVQHEVIRARNHICPPGTAICRVGKDGKGISLGDASSQKLIGNGDNGLEGLILQYGNGDETCTLASGSKVAASTRIRFICSKSMQTPTFVKGPDSNCTYEFEWKMIGGCPETEPEEVYQKDGFIYHERFPHWKINMASLIDNTFIADEVHRDRYVYLFQIGQGVKPDNKTNPCHRAAVCQTKPNSTFFRDLGSVQTQKYYLQGNDLKLVLTSNGKPCGKNKNKIVTTTVTFHCSQDEGLGSPEFLYESNNCDYLFNWETSVVCHPFTERSVATNSFNKESHIAVSTEVIVGLVLSLTLVVILIGVFAKEERRSAVVYKMKSCFHKVKLPRYRYIQSPHTDGDPILLSPDEPLQRFQEESDSDIVT